MPLSVTKKEADGSRRTLTKLFPVVLKADTQMVVQDTMIWEDAFANFYYTSKNKDKDKPLVQPPYNPVTLMGLVTRNNTLAQCIEAYEVNIDGTGFTVEKIDENGGDDEAEKTKLNDFYTNPWTDETGISLRRKLRYDLEATGNGYLEVLENLDGEIMGMRWLDTTTVRLVRLDDPVQVERTILRNGKEETVLVNERERRYAQVIGEKLLYFRDFNSSRQCNRETGNWENPKDALTIVPKDKRATRIIHFIVARDIATGYGLPRWINQLPSVLGSRKAEEQNLEFYDAGGVPPSVVFVAGGQAGEDVVRQLEGWFSPKSKNKHRVAVVGVESSSGSLDSPGKVTIQTERFGDSNKDPMFAAYDAKAEEKVRGGFRLPALFLGKGDDANFATAMTSYMVTEAQVFKPERTEFDDTMKMTVSKALGAKLYKMHSNPITLQNAELQLKAVDTVKDKVDGEDLVETVNEITGLHLEFSQEAADAASAQANAGAGLDKDGNPIPKGPPQADGTNGQNVPTGGTTMPGGGSANVGKADTHSPMGLIKLASLYAVAAGFDDGEMDEKQQYEVLAAVEKLDGDAREIFDHALAARLFNGGSLDTDGLAQVAGFAAARAVKGTVKKTGCCEGHHAPTNITVSPIGIELKLDLTSDKPGIKTATLPGGEQIVVKHSPTTMQATATMPDGKTVTMKTEKQA